MEERYIATVDLGSSKIALTVARISGEDIQILFYKEMKSDGIRNSAVFNPQKASAPIRAAIQEAESELNIKILQVVVGLPRCDVRQETATAEYERTNPDESITKEEVENLKRLAVDEYPLKDPAKEELYGAIAQSFSSDEEFQMIESDIIGMISSKFGGSFQQFIGKKSSVKAIDNVFNGMGIAIARKYFTPGSIAKAVLTEDEIDNGVALIDLGGGASSVNIYKDKILRSYAWIPFGGKTVTADIHSECAISEDLAENIKKAFGACMPGKLQNLEEKIIQIEGDESGIKQIPVKYLSEIITAREREIIEAILWYIQESGYADSLRSGVVITGGGAKMTNIANYFKELSGYEVRVGYPRRLYSASGYPDACETGATNSIGMLLAAKNDGLLNCITAPEVVEPVIEPEPEPEPEPIAEQPDEPQTQPVNPETQEEKNSSKYQKWIAEQEEDEKQRNLFGEEEIQKTTKKPKKEPKESRGTLIWRKVTSAFGNFYEEVSKESDEEV